MTLNKGYSLIELLVVITLISVLGTLTAETFLLGIRAQAKSEVMKEVKQNADYVGQVIDNMVRNSIDIEEAQCNSDTGQTLTIQNPDGNYTTFDCTGSVMSSISGIFPVPTVSLNLSSTRVAIEECNFRIICPTPPLNPKYVFLNFKVSQTGSSLPKEQQASIEYQTTVSLRNYQ
ncbi:hypothetical protein A3E42_01290 [Candidatus Gottesmanbacteria bacterium RIFCSPHIGHO2_12_FULL_40_13]|nr:MAG: hypothetical protein A3E42_01290 [Candidatus Gottesmanbacteria bacterium RIFCSPHIGHO2_12_FULL_40_13]